MSGVVSKRYVPKPIEACKITKDNLHAIAEWCGGEVYNKDEEPSDTISIGSSEKTYIADIGDYVVKTPTGSFYTINGESFESLYESVWW